MSLLLYFLAVFGLAYIVGHSKISLPVRDYLSPTGEGAKLPLGGFGAWLVELTECPACFSFHVGFWCGFLRWPLHALAGNRMADALLLGCASAGMSFILGRLTKLI